MTERRFPKLTRKQILEQLWNGKPLISDEEAFERHLVRKWSKKMNKKPFVVIHDKENNVILMDNIEKRKLLFFQFKNYEEAEDCRKGLMLLCTPMNRIAKENYSLKKLLCDTTVGRLAKENQELKNEISQLQAYNSACEDTLLNVDVTVHQMLGTAEKEFNKKFTAAKIWNGSSSKSIFHKLAYCLIRYFIGKVT